MATKEKNEKAAEGNTGKASPATARDVDAFDRIFGDDNQSFQIASSKGWRFWAASEGEVLVGFLLRGSYNNQIAYSNDATFYEFETTRPCRAFREDMESTEVVPAGTIVSVLEKAVLKKLRAYADHPKHMFEVAIRCGAREEFESKNGGKQSVWRYDIRARLTDRPKPIAEGLFLEQLEGGEPWDRARRELPEGARA